MSYELNSRIVDNSETVLPTDDSKLIVEVHETGFSPSSTHRTFWPG
jgi:hypothetical protein